MSNVLMVFCTFPNPEQARQIGTALVEKQLAACVNLLPAVESIYRWQGQVETAAETLAIFKIAAAGWPGFEAELSRLHPYEIPEIVAVEPAAVAANYSAWVATSTLPSPQ